MVPPSKLSIKWHFLIENGIKMYSQPSCLIWPLESSRSRHFIGAVIFIPLNMCIFWYLVWVCSLFLWECMLYIYMLCMFISIALSQLNMTNTTIVRFTKLWHLFCYCRLTPARLNGNSNLFKYICWGKLSPFGIFLAYVAQNCVSVDSCTIYFATTMFLMLSN